MIETLSIAGPLAVLRAQAGHLPTPKPPERAPEVDLMPPDPTAPAGPRPSFESTPLEQLRETQRVDPARQNSEARSIASPFPESLPAKVDRIV